MSDDPQQAPSKFADEDPYGDEQTDGATPPGAGDEDEPSAGDDDS